MPQHILIIDDDDVMRELLPLTLAADGHVFITAASGAEALTLVASNSSVNIVLADMQMPGITGAALAAELRSACAARLIGMSGSEPAAQDRAAFDAFLLKPFTSEEFAAAMLPTSAPTPQQTAAHPAPPALALDEGIYATLAATLPATALTQLYEMCLTDAARRLDHMEAAARAADHDTFTREAHAIKGSCGMLGAAELQALAARMETGAVPDTSLLADFRVASERLRRILAAHP
jgi:CheY-like chemotaxis protein